METVREKIIDAIVNADLMGTYKTSLKIGDVAYKLDLDVLTKVDIEDRFQDGSRALSKLIECIDLWTDSLDQLSKGAKKLGKRASILRRFGYNKDNEEIS